MFNTTYEKRSNEILAQREAKHAHTEFSTNETLHNCRDSIFRTVQQNFFRFASNIL